MSKTTPDLFLQGGDKFTGQLNEMCKILVMCAEEKNEQKGKSEILGMWLLDCCEVWRKNNLGQFLKAATTKIR